MPATATKIWEFYRISTALIIFRPVGSSEFGNGSRTSPDSDSSYLILFYAVDDFFRTSQNEKYFQKNQIFKKIISLKIFYNEKHRLKEIKHKLQIHLK
jgi:hypothetical protein